MDKPVDNNQEYSPVDNKIADKLVDKPVDNNKIIDNPVDNNLIKYTSRK